jgi:glycosyltransferase involved in cell wall biosynthesis
MKKLLIMASLFWPQKNSGGPPISIMNLVQSIKGKFEISIVSNNHELGEDTPLPGVKEGWNEFDFGKVYYVNRGDHTPEKIGALIREIAPDVIYQNSFFSYNDLYPVLTYKKKHKKDVKVIVAPRGEFYPERFAVGKPKKLAYCVAMRLSGLLRDVYFQGTGEEECEQERRRLGIKPDHLLNIQNLSTVSGDMHPIEKKSGELRLVYVARVHPTKNTLGAIKHLAKVEGRVEYDIYGSIENEDYWKQCQDAIAALPHNVTVTYRGVVSHDRVTDIIRGYHAYYMPTTGENFGHSIVESMLVGRPVIISDQTPWTDAHGVCGYALPLSDEEGFVAALNELTQMDDGAYARLCENAPAYINQKLNTAETVQKYVDAFEEL